MLRCRKERLRELRKQRGLNQQELADLAAVGKRTLQNAEAGVEGSMDTVILLAAALEVHPDEILDQEHVDALAQGPYEFHRYVNEFLHPEGCAYCADDEDAFAAVEQMRENWILHISGDDREVLPQPYRHGYDFLLASNFEDYRARYVSLWKQHRRTVLFATKSGRRTGISVILPVADEVYQQLLNGEITFLDITAEHLRERSQSLVIDSCVEFARERKGPWYDFTDSLRFVVFYQIATLSFDTMAEGFRIVSFGASPLNAERLSANGFRKLPASMPDFHFPIYEFADHSKGEADIQRRTFEHYARIYQEKSASDGGLALKQNFMRRYLRAYQLLLDRYPNLDRRTEIA